MNHRRKLIEVALPLEVIKGPGAGAVPFVKTSISSYNRKMLLRHLSVLRWLDVHPRVDLPLPEEALFET